MQYDRKPSFSLIRAGYLLSIVLITFICAYLLFSILTQPPVVIVVPSPTPDIMPANNDTINGLRYRLVYIRDELDVPGNLEKVQETMRRAKAAGYNGVVFSNLWSQNNLETLSKATPEYNAKLAAVRNTANAEGLELYPAVLTVGYASPILANDPNLVEGLPVKYALYVVHNGQADIVADPPVSLPGGDFEVASNDVFYGWDSQNWPGTNTIPDTSVMHSGSQSLRVEAKGISRVEKMLDVSPYRQYHLSMWVKTQGIVDTKSTEPFIGGVDDNRQLSYLEDNVKETQDWTHYDIVFNSLGNDQITISLGTWDWNGGTMWIDDVTIEEIGMTNIIRRSEYPLVVMGEDGTIYKEGVDFEPVSDPLLGVTPTAGYYSVYHAGPTIRLTPDSRIKEGQRLRLSYYTVGMTYSGQVSISLTDPGSRALFQKVISNVDKTMSPDGILLNYNEIRVGNWEVRQKPMTEGQVIAYSIRTNYDYIHKTDPGLKVMVWNDMFDPYHNANGKLGLINGTCDGSYEGLDPGVIILNWDYGLNRTNSLKFFTERGNPQVLAGYYDGEAPPIGQWLWEARDEKADVVGVMYTTWNSDYSGLESFARDAWGNSSG